MITGDITISFLYGGVSYTLTVDGSGDNLPYNLADAFCEVIEKSDANHEIVIEQMKEQMPMPAEEDV